MHMADALLSPAVGGGMWAAAALTLTISAKKLDQEGDSSHVPLMGVLGAFIFAAQMINVAIPGTGASGHLGGGILLAMLLGPYAAFVVMASILTVQAFFFADGGLLALGCNMINLGFIPVFIAYPLIYRRYAAHLPLGRKRNIITSLATIIALQLGALAVVAETSLSGMSSLNIGQFLLLMQPIHLLIGIGESLITVCVFNVIATAEPWRLQPQPSAPPSGKRYQQIVALAVTTILVGGLLSSFASSQPDGLEWSLEQATPLHAQSEVSDNSNAPPSIWHQQLDRIQSFVAPLPDYSFTPSTNDDQREINGGINSGTATSGLLGGLLTALLIVSTTVLLRRKRQRIPTNSVKD